LFSAGGGGGGELGPWRGFGTRRHGRGRGAWGLWVASVDRHHMEAQVLSLMTPVRATG
jgi:hypothetical protein